MTLLLVIVFVVAPLLELAVIVQVAGAIGTFDTIVLLVLVSMVGAWLAKREGIGVLGMKSMGSGIILKSGVVSAVECLRYALTLPASVIITGIDSTAILDQACEVAESFTPMTSSQIASLLARTRDTAARGHFEPFKTSSMFDATASNPEWLGEEPPRVQKFSEELEG